MRNDNQEIVSLRLEATKANSGIYGGAMHPALQEAAFEDKLETCKRLLDAGADPNAQGGRMGSPLHAAVWRGSVDLIWLLLNSGADSSIRDRSGRSALHLSLACRQHVLVLLESGANTNVVDRTGTMPLQSAARSHPRIVPQLLAAGAMAGVRDGCGRSVLHAAMGADKLQFQNVLDHLPESRRKDDLEAALPAVLKQPAEPGSVMLEQCKQIFHLILGEDNIDLSVPDPNGWTALELAECYGLNEEAYVLEQRGAQKGNLQQALRPSCWSSADRNPEVFLSEDKMEAWVTAISPSREVSMQLSSAI
ncbi:ankyrin [Aspergillus steynii IBT 23096]|uniref:Ankyrin n=1 Tax=Aspergillus steynii IBT 23096 TaxID=1392250 RepID=A0A2I2GNW5_9EURO|nr:ankyrin [Aspergillus steynii IBT 23096]PLB54559.1 ankyrin [Aspergillus steynii IBT 23096]